MLSALAEEYPHALELRLGGAVALDPNSDEAESIRCAMDDLYDGLTDRELRAVVARVRTRFGVTLADLLALEAAAAAGDEGAARRVPSARTKLGLCAACRGPLGERAMACDRCIAAAVREVQRRDRELTGEAP